MLFPSQEMVVASHEHASSRVSYLTINFCLFYFFCFLGHLIMPFAKLRFTCCIVCEWKAIPIRYCGKWSKWDRCWQVRRSFFFLPFFYWIFLFRIIIMLGFLQYISIIFRFDYLVRDSRACGLGCSFQFERYDYDLEISITVLYDPVLYSKQSIW